MFGYEIVHVHQKNKKRLGWCACGGTTVRMWVHGRAHAHATVRAHAGVVRARPRTRAHRKYRLAEDVAASEAANQAHENAEGQQEEHELAHDDDHADTARFDACTAHARSWVSTSLSKGSYPTLDFLLCIVFRT